MVGCVDDLVDAPWAGERKIYLDRENSRPVSQATVEAMGPYFQDNKVYGNPINPHKPSWMAYASITEEKLAKSLPKKREGKT